MARLDDEQQAALRKFKQEALGVEPDAQPLRATTSSMTFADRSSLPVPEVAKIVGCQVSDVLMILRRIGSAKKSSSSGLTVGEAETVRDEWNASSSSAARPTLPLGLLAAELEVDLHLLAIEARRAGIPVQGEREAFTLFEVEADHLRRFAARWPGKLVRAAGPAVGGIRTSALTRKQASMVDGVKAPTRQNRPSTASAITRKAIPEYAFKLASNSRILPVNKAAQLPATGALTPPKPAAVVDIQRAQVTRSKSVELDPDNKPIIGGLKVTPDAPPLVTNIGRGSSEVEALQQTLGGFAPKDHAVLFRELSVVLGLDEQIARSFPRDTAATRITDHSLRDLMRIVCHGKFGLFAYHEVSNTLRSAARKNCRTASASTLTHALANLRPMHTGVLTDLGKSRFIVWHVEGHGSKLAIVTFGAITDWVLGIDRGQYVPLRGRVIAIARGARLQDADRGDAQFMAEAATKLRKGIHIRRVSPTDNLPRRRNYLDGPPAHSQRNLTYKPHSDWLVPVVVEDGFVTGGLREGFFSNHGGRAAHAVRGFIRRAPGSSVNDPKTAFVSAHTRGGYDVGDIGFMPTVTILRDKERPLGGSWEA